MEKQQKHFVLVHGAYTGAWCWYKVVTLLKSAGHKVTALDLGASGIHPKQVHEIVSISDYYEPLMEFMTSLTAEEKVILVGHSLGGISISAAMERFPDKVSVAVFATALSVGPDLNFDSIGQEFNRRGLLPTMDVMEYKFDKGLEKPPTSSFPRLNYLSSSVYQLCPPEDLTLATFLTRPTPIFQNQPVELTEEKYGSVRRVYVVCDEDAAITENLQRWMIEINPPEEVKVIVGSDHMVMFSKPKEFCSCLQEIAEKYC